MVIFFCEFTFWGRCGGSPAEGVGAYWRGLCRIRSIRPAGAAMSLRSIRRANRTVGGDVPQKWKYVGARP